MIAVGDGKGRFYDVIATPPQTARKDNITAYSLSHVFIPLLVGATARRANSPSSSCCLGYKQYGGDLTLELKLRMNT